MWSGVSLSMHHARSLVPLPYLSNWCMPAAVCAWPGREGAALVLSCMLRTPLVPSLLSYTPATASYQAAFAGELLELCES